MAVSQQPQYITGLSCYLNHRIDMATWAWICRVEGGMNITSTKQYTGEINLGRFKLPVPANNSSHSTGWQETPARAASAPSSSTGARAGQRRRAATGWTEPQWRKRRASSCSCKGLLIISGPGFEEECPAQQYPVAVPYSKRASPVTIARVVLYSC